MSTIYVITFVANLKTKCEVLITVNNIFTVLVLNLLYLWGWYWQRYGATLLLNSSRRLYFIISKSTVRAFKWHKNYLLKEWNSRQQQPCCPLLKRKFIFFFHHILTITTHQSSITQCDLCVSLCCGEEVGYSLSWFKWVWATDIVHWPAVGVELYTKCTHFFFSLKFSLQCT